MCVFCDETHTLDDVRAIAAKYEIEIYRTTRRINKPDCMILFHCEVYQSWHWYGGTSYMQDEQQAIDFAYHKLESLQGKDKDEIMNILGDNKLFPHIKGVMLKKPVTLTLSGKVNITELQGGDARCELFFLDHAKTAVVNRNQVLKIVDMYGSETNDWNGKRITLYGEQGVWFGKKQWGIRIENQIPPEKKRKQAAQKAIKALDELSEEIKSPVQSEYVPQHTDDELQLFADIVADSTGASAGAFDEA